MAKAVNVPRLCRIKSHLHLRPRPPQAAHGWGDMGWPAGLAARPCTFLPVWGGSGCMVCSENYFSTATGLNHGGALSISRHLADLVITYTAPHGGLRQTTPCLPTTVGPDDR